MSDEEGLRVSCGAAALLILLFLPPDVTQENDEKLRTAFCVTCDLKARNRPRVARACKSPGCSLRREMLLFGNFRHV